MNPLQRGSVQARFAIRDSPRDTLLDSPEAALAHAESSRGRNPTPDPGGKPTVSAMRGLQAETYRSARQAMSQPGKSSKAPVRPVDLI